MRCAMRVHSRMLKENSSILDETCSVTLIEQLNEPTISVSTLAQGTVRAFGVIVLPPLLDDDLGFLQ